MRALSRLAIALVVLLPLSCKRPDPAAGDRPKPVEAGMNNGLFDATPSASPAIERTPEPVADPKQHSPGQREWQDVPLVGPITRDRKDMLSTGASSEATTAADAKTKP